MIQRIQSIFMVALITGSALLLFIPSIVFSTVNQSPLIVEITLLPLFKAAGVSVLVFVPAFLNLDVLLLSVIALFSFKNRKKQMSYMSIVMLLSLLNFFALYGFDFFPSETKTKLVQWPCYIPLLQFLFALLARIYVKKDDDLVRSADRLR